MLSAAAYKPAPSWEVDLGIGISASLVFRLYKAGEENKCFAGCMPLLP